MLFMALGDWWCLYWLCLCCALCPERQKDCIAWQGVDKHPSWNSSLSVWVGGGSRIQRNHRLVLTGENYPLRIKKKNPLPCTSLHVSLSLSVSVCGVCVCVVVDTGITLGTSGHRVSVGKGDPWPWANQTRGSLLLPPMIPSGSHLSTPLTQR